jgi:PPOX class probable F420-dependent enzyme
VGALPDYVRSFLDEQPVGVLGTRRADGSIRQSLVYHVTEGDRILISTESQRAKARDVEHWARASYCVFGHEPPFPSVTVEGPARVLAAGIGGPTTRIFEKITGQTMADPFTDEALTSRDRVVLEIDVERVYGPSHLDEKS